MIKKFVQFITESEGNVYQQGTPFSNGHRSRRKKNGFLESWHYMIDIDKVIVNSEGKIVGIIETKGTTPGVGSRIQNILTEETSQKAALLQISKQLSKSTPFHIFVEIESERRYYWLSKDKTEFGWRSFDSVEFLQNLTNKGLKIVSTDNQVFIEFRMNSSGVTIKGIAFRIESNWSNKIYSEQLASGLGVTHVEVDDTTNKIKFSKNGEFIGETDSVLFPTSVSDIERKRIENDWESIYRKMNLWN